jgi:hypothetical protein
MAIARGGVTGLRIGAWTAYASGAVAAIGVPLLIGMYAVVFRSGPNHPRVARLGGANDAMVLAQYALALPLAVVLHQRNRSTDPRFSGAATAVGMSAMTAIVVLQALLLADVLEFEDQIAYVAIAFWLLVFWFITVGRLGRANGLLTGRTTLMSLVGASYIGFPIWAFWLGRQLSRAAAGDS